MLKQDYIGGEALAADVYEVDYDLGMTFAEGEKSRRIGEVWDWKRDENDKS